MTIIRPTNMYQSRFRCKRSGQQESDGRRNNKRHTTSSNIYTNRSNRYVIDRMIDVGRKRLEKSTSDKIAMWTRKKEQLEEERAHLCTEDLDVYTRRWQLSRDIKRLETDIQQYTTRAHMDAWDLRTRRLYCQQNNHVSRLIFCHRILERATEYFFVDPDTCPHCHILYMFNQITNVHTCPSCGYTVNVLFISEDNSQDVLVNKDPSGAATDAAATERTTDKPSRSEYQYVRGPLYRRYLGQFAEDVPELPLEVLRVLYKYLSNIHLQNSIRCRPTPVANILRTHGYPRYAGSATRITKIFNGEPVPRLPADLIDRLVARFNEIFKQSSQYKKKLPPFEFITNILLCVEGREDLAFSFSMHKTRIVLRRIADALYKIIDAIRDQSAFSWDNLPVF